jgi:cytochrome c oxidase assembly protein subunit 15
MSKSTGQSQLSRAANWIFTSLLVLQGLLIVTGGAVRLTGSGLGCPTWPECTNGSIKPVAHQAQGQLHAWIEFGNRLIAWVIFFVAIASLLYVIRNLKDRRDYKVVRLLALSQLLGFLAQVILGGITVLTKLNPVSVSLHFMLSVPLIAAALSLRTRVAAREKNTINETTTLVSKIVLALTLCVIVAGTIVTGSGPHAGDIQAKRYHIQPRTISYLHADLVIALLAFTIGLWLIIRASEDKLVRQSYGKKVAVFLAISLAQGAIGYVQYFTGLPELIVGLHLLGVTLVWVACWDFYSYGVTAKGLTV